MGEYLEFSGKNTADALMQAEQHFSLPASRLDVDILSTGSGGILGMFGKKALIRVRPANSNSVQETVAQILNNGRVAEPLLPKPQPEAAVQPAALLSVVPVAPSQQADKAEAGELNVAELISAAEQVVARLSAPLAAQIEMVSTYEDNQLSIAIKYNEPGVLIGRRAQILDALQYLAARIVSHKFGRSIALVLDVEGYRARQLKQLEEAVLKLADKVLAHNRPYTLGPLGTPERRLVHKILRDKPLQSYSKGQGDLKRVVIAPASSKR